MNQWKSTMQQAETKKLRFILKNADLLNTEKESEMQY